MFRQHFRWLHYFTLRILATARPAKRNPRRLRLKVEALESRYVPSTVSWDNGGDGSD